MKEMILKLLLNAIIEINQLDYQGDFLRSFCLNNNIPIKSSLNVCDFNSTPEYNMGPWYSPYSFSGFDPDYIVPYDVTQLYRDIQNYWGDNHPYFLFLVFNEAFPEIDFYVEIQDKRFLWECMMKDSITFEQQKPIL